MPKDILINAGAAEIRVATVEDGRLEALSCTRILDAEDGHGLVGDIVLGRVARVVPAVQAAFVDIGRDRAGFLGAWEARCLAPPGDDDPQIGALVREGETVLVQVIKDQLGEKGPRLSASISLPGRLCVLTPFQPGIAVSRRIEGDAERARLEAIGAALPAEGIEGAGFIFRTAASGAGEDEIREDARRVVEDWHMVLEVRRTAKAPALLHRDLDPVARALRDLVRDDTRRILIDDATAFESARAFCRRSMPHAEDRLEQFRGPGALFDDLEPAIDCLMVPRVALRCGGWITIEATEALTAVDVNSGSFTHASGLEDTALAVNLEAADELGRQVRLRGIGGLIVVDFIHMKEPQHGERVLEAVRQGLSKDGVPVTVAPMSPFGLVEITRKRVREPLLALRSEVCAACVGQGVARRAEAVALDVVRRVESSARAAPGKPIRVRAAPDVVRWLEGWGEALRSALARRGAPNVRFEVDQDCTRERFDVGT